MSKKSKFYQFQFDQQVTKQAFLRLFYKGAIRYYVSYNKGKSYSFAVKLFL